MANEAEVREERMSRVPKIWRIPVANLDRRCHPNGSDAEYLYGCYFPQTDLNVNEMGGRSTGKPLRVDWVDVLLFDEDNGIVD